MSEISFFKSHESPYLFTESAYVGMFLEILHIKTRDPNTVSLPNSCISMGITFLFSD